VKLLIIPFSSSSGYFLPFASKRSHHSVLNLRFSFSGTALGYGTDDRGFESRQGLGIFLFTTASRSALGPVQWISGARGRSVKLNTHLHLVPRSKNAWSYTSTPPIRPHGVLFRDNFTFTFIITLCKKQVSHPHKTKIIILYILIFLSF
jgi:hypothetical protein